MTDLYDLIIIGGGPAGLSAAIYMARAKYRVLVLEKEKFGGQITITSEVVNYPGIERISGSKLTESMRIQASSFGAEFKLAEVVDFVLDGDIKKIITKQGEFRCLSVILATGASPRKLGFTGEKEFQGRGVAYCATCDGEFFTGLDVFVIGGGFAAAEEGMFLTRYAKKVRMIIREPDFTCVKSIADEVKENKNIDIYYNTEVKEVGGNSLLKYAEFINNETEETWRYEAEDDSTFGVFVFAGYVPATSLLKGKVELDDYGYIITDNKQNTNISGVCAAGDVCVKDLRQVVTAVSDGATAATTLEKHVSAMYEKLKLERTDYETKTDKESFDTKKDQSLTFIEPSMIEQLQAIFSKFERHIMIKAKLDDRPISREVQTFLEEVTGISDKISYIIDDSIDENLSYEKPYMELLDDNGVSFRTGFHGVPGGHEFNSFILSLYNAAGPGQAIDADLVKKIKAINHDISIKVIISLSCTMCPELVTSVQRIAIMNPRVKAEIFDMAHYPEIKEKYKIMSVPCFILDDEEVHFGKKNIAELTDILNHYINEKIYTT